MDLSKLSDSDLMALKTGKLSNVSDEGLSLLKDSAPQKTFSSGLDPRLEQAMGGGVNILDLPAGAVRGAGSIGATIMAPKDIITDALAGKGLSLESNRQRRASIDEALQTMGADPNSGLYKTGKLAGEIAGTAGTGSLLAKGAQAAGATPQVIRALQTSGLSTGGGMGRVADLALRTGAGAVVGGASAGLVNPEDAGAGAVIGGVAPGVIQAAGNVGEKIGNVIRGPEQSPEALNAIKQAHDLGYVIPPTQAKPTLINRMLEGYAGKISTAQNASAKNSEISNALAARHLGLPSDMPITPEVLNDVRKTAGQAYEAIGKTGTITPGESYGNALEKIAEPYRKAAEGFPLAKKSPVIDLVDSLMSPAFDAKSAISKISTLREEADTAFRQGDKSLGRSIKAASSVLENAVEDHLKTIGKPDLLNDFKDARQLIAKSYTVERALNPTTGTIDAMKLGEAIKRGKPLVGELKQIGDFANRFPKAVQTPERMGSLPGVSPLDFAAGGMMAMHDPSMLATIAGRPAARNLALSKMVQDKLSSPANSKLSDLLTNQKIQQLMLRGAPIASTQ